MSLTLQAITYMIWLSWASLAVSIALWVSLPLEFGPVSVAALALQLGALYLIRIGLRRGLVWVAIVFAMLCMIDLFSAMAGGLEIVNAVNLADAVLSLVALCGLVLWRKDLRAATASE